MIRKTALLLILTITVLAGCAHQKSKSRADGGEMKWDQMRGRIKLQLAQRSFDKGVFDEALLQCGEALGLDPANVDGHLLMARIYLEKGEPAVAEAALDQAAALDRDNPEIYYLRGLAAERKNQSEQAVQFYQRAYQGRPEELDYLSTYVEVLLNAGQVDEALRTLESRREDFAQEPTVHLLMGQALSFTERRREAADCFLTAVRLAPEDTLVREQAVVALLAAERVPEAVVTLTPLLESPSRPPSVSLVRKAAAALLKNKAPLRVIALLEPAIKRQGDDPACWLLLARAYLEVNQPEKAGQAIAEALALNPHSAEAKLLLAYQAMCTGRKQDAARTARQILQQNPNDAQAQALLAKALAN